MISCLVLYEEGRGIKGSWQEAAIGGRQEAAAGGSQSLIALFNCMRLIGQAFFNTKVQGVKGPKKGNPSIVFNL
jgi:hypothetical protein